MSLLTTPSPDAPLPPPDPGSDAPAPPAPAARPRRRHRWQRWSRLVHVYSSMVVLVVIVFFGATGITLNHPEWSFGLEPTTTSVQAQVPAAALAEDGDVDLLALSTYLRDQQGVGGEITDSGLNADQGDISYRGPGYSADVTIDVAAGTYDLEVEQQSLIGVLNDLHKGRSANSLWRWVIDISGGLLVLTAGAGLALQLTLRKRRTAALVVATVGGAAAAMVVMTTLA